MRYMRAAVLCCAIVAASSVALSASASAAAPEFGRCIKFKASEKPFTGKYTNSSCTAKSEAEEGKYEWLPGVEKNHFTATGTAVNLEGTTLSNRIHCESSALAGEYSGAKEVKNVSLTLHGCKMEAIRVCVVASEPEKPIELTGLEGIVGLDEVASPYNAGLDLYRAGRGTITELLCGGIIIPIRGSVIGQLKTNKMSKNETLKYVGAPGLQMPSHLEGEPIDMLEGRNADIGEAFGVFGLTLKATIANEEQVEVNTAV